MQAGVCVNVPTEKVCAAANIVCEKLAHPVGGLVNVALVTTHGVMTTLKFT